MIPLGTLAGSRYAPTGPPVLTSDSFNRANGELSGSTDAALGGTPLPWHVIDYDPFVIISNRLGAGGRFAYAAVNVGVRSMAASFRVVTLGNNPHLIFFVSSKDEDGGYDSSYELSITAARLRLSFGSGNSADAPNTLTDGDIVQLVSDFPDVSARVNGVTVASITAGGNRAPGTYAGIHNYGQSPTWQIDDFKVTEVEAV